MKYCFYYSVFFSLVVDALDYRVVSRGTLHVRSGAGSEFDVIGKLASKDTVHVLKMEEHGRKWSLMENRLMSVKSILCRLGERNNNLLMTFFVDYGDCLNRDRLVICLY